MENVVETMAGFSPQLWRNTARLEVAETHSKEDGLLTAAQATVPALALPLSQIRTVPQLRALSVDLNEPTSRVWDLGMSWHQSSYW